MVNFLSKAGARDEAPHVLYVRYDIIACVFAVRGGVALLLVAIISFVKGKYRELRQCSSCIST
ncbi:hypothetical protein FIBSPDRAFT_537364 [Athelia psychrophila]|uniref:Uncharacterized protein n=1 Tax=Athelia psychrophila TaxID=1759441 RepID=A0A166J7D5_9AGAM|nr:hypothetical protein FIBSPDRAFT_537364 [Fibularhizoctonia sp. CBS 109695]